MTQDRESSDLKVFAGSSHPSFAADICDYLGIDVGESHTVSFSNENLLVQIDENVRGCDVFVVQTSCSPVHTNLMETLITCDALRGASAARITAVVPYLPYIRSDKKDRPRISITARLVADLLKESGADRVLTMDLHAPQSQGFFRMPVDQLIGAGPICEVLADEVQDDWILVAADAGEAKDLGSFANRLDLPMAIIDKRRYGDDEKPRAEHLIGDVEGRTAVIVDDEIASGGTLVEAAEFLVENGASSVRAAATHPVFTPGAVDRLASSPLERVTVTDTVPVENSDDHDFLEVIGVAPMFAEAISRIHDGRSVSALFSPEAVREILFG
jgi:ribose-phosphate pyrophosphokinase